MHHVQRSLPIVLFVSIIHPCLNLTALDQVQMVVGTPNNQCKVVNTYPEYWVDGKPFIVYSGSFLYQRLPRDRWAGELLHQKEMGINAVELLPMWAWHEPEEGRLDFDGRTSPRRDLKYLLRLIDTLGLKLSFGPGPYLTGEWRNGGYPDWLLRRPEYRMSEQAILEGRYPRWAALQYSKSEESATQWLKNDTHLRYTQQWFHDAIGLVNPLLADKGGPVISIQIDDDQACGFGNYNGPNFWKYMDLLREYCKAATKNSPIPYYIDAADMRLNAEANDATAEPFWNMGQDYQSSAEQKFSDVREAGKNKFLTEVLKTQPLFIPGHIEFQTGWFPTPGDTYTVNTDPSNELMAMSVMFQNGLKLLNFYPPGDTLYPAGFETQWTNHFYVWDAAVNYAGMETGRAIYTRRYGRLLNGMGPLLGAAHFLPDAGLVYPMATYPQAVLTEAEADYIVTFAARVLWAGTYDHYNFELIDSDHTPAANFQRYKLLLLPNLAGGKAELKQYPHLERYSEKAQRMIRDYVSAGGTLLVFPTLPVGKVWDELLAPLGGGRQVVGNEPVKFEDGTTALALGGHTTLTLPKDRRTNVKVFARDVHGGIVGARFTSGQGQVVFYGADFSTWSVPGGPETTFGHPVKAEVKDCPEEAQKEGRKALPALMKEVGLDRKVYVENGPGKARDLYLYVTELIADAGSKPFEKRASEEPGFGFVGVTNFSGGESKTAELHVTDPHLTDLSANTPDRYLHLPKFTLPPRQSVLLPVHVPLNSKYGEVAAGLRSGDEVVYATAELSKIGYDGKTLHLEFTAPAEGEVALRLGRRPGGARIDGQGVPIQEDAARQWYVLRIPKGEAPHFLRKVELAYAGEGLRVSLDARGPWIADETRSVQVRVENPQAEAWEGQMEFAAGRFHREDTPTLGVSIPGQASRDFSFPVEIPADGVDNQLVELKVTLKEKGTSRLWVSHGQAKVHQPFTWQLGPVLDFPLREDQHFPIVHPTLVSVKLPGEVRLQVHLKNWREHEQVVTLQAEGGGLELTPARSQVALPTGGESTLEVKAAPLKGTGVYRLDLSMRAGDHREREGVVVAAVQSGEAITYPLDYDRDGFEDIILENTQVRLYVSPLAGGRAFGFVRKETNTNAFDSVGGMRDNFTVRAEPDDLKGLEKWTRANWLGLYNRPYSYKIVTASGTEARVELQYTAPDIYPKGVKLQRTLTLHGDQPFVEEETALTPLALDKPQSYMLETSVPFRVFTESNYNQWYAQGRAVEEFVPLRSVELSGSEGYVGTANRQTGESFALLTLTPAAKIQVAADNHSAMIHVTYPKFAAKNETYRYRVVYYFGKASPEEIDRLYVQLKAKK